jgi:hypothetical protein
MCSRATCEKLLGLRRVLHLSAQGFPCPPQGEPQVGFFELFVQVFCPGLAPGLP